MTVPDKMQALITQANKTTKVETVPTPDIDDDEVLVKTVAIALNHTDWKHIEFINNPGTIVGCDFSGTVVKVGKAVTTLFEGDHVAGFTHGGTFKDLGAFAEYVKSPADLVWKVPGGTLSHEQAATFGCAFYTAVQALFNPNRLALIEPPGEAAAPEWVLINGGTASVGMFAIQLARIAGYEVLAVASKKPELAKSLGANAVVDYKDPEAVTQIRHATHEGIHSGLDAIATDDTQEFSIRSFGPGEGKLIVTLNAYKGAQELRPDVEIQSTLVYTVFGRSFDFLGTHYDPVPDDREHMAAFLQKLPTLVKSGHLKPNPVILWPGGLQEVTDGLDFLREGKHSGEKVVYRIG